jgi:transcription initiation factor IIE alpha subunit
MIQSTSLEAYHILEPNLGEKQQTVYDTILRHPESSNYELSQILNWRINSITPRVKELRDKGLVLCCGHKKDVSTGMNVMIWRTIGETTI